MRRWLLSGGRVVSGQDVAAGGRWIRRIVFAGRPVNL